MGGTKWARPAQQGRASFPGQPNNAGLVVVVVGFVGGGFALFSELFLGMAKASALGLVSLS